MSISSANAAEYHNQQLKLYAERIEARLEIIDRNIDDRMLSVDDKELNAILEEMKRGPFSE